ncbi:phenylalanine 4-monooxygenase [Marihabitans asiaticum]|uniref:Phenylalanine-4-hydroxylase n=1 Tax=Marihabitans asiaticum TaxID=415218 RepID=A0A560WDX2_9MICO|nr:phenylalanine 4-monooxygenase [Marihabitans asiaticum]TWD15730.1 phenylalanine-4-hydroxylase [Marihabitans asiaticum]
MFEDGQLYSPVTEHEDGTVQVHLADTHPGKDDAHYLRRRGEIAGAALRWDRAGGAPLPTIEYTDTEHAVWAEVCRELAPKHLRYAHSEFLAAKDRLDLPTDHVPQLHEVTERLEPLTGWTYIAAPGLVPLREFYGDLGQRTFSSTQYLRHASQPLYTPEPDIIHEVIGHGNGLASERFARITEAAGQALTRMESEEAAKLVADVFWFSMEFGVIYEAGPVGARELKAYGAGILSSFGEMDEFREMEIRDLDLADMGTLNYDITQYQPILFAAKDLGHLEDVVGDFFATADDDACARLRREAEGRGLVPERV